MQMQDIFDELLAPAAAARARSLQDGLDARAPGDWRTLAAVLAVLLAEAGIRTVAVAGGQGSGKSTLAGLLVAASQMLGQRAISASLDDFYLTRAERRELAERIHPLFATRGVPGTHDVALCRRTLDAALGTGLARIPRFDKGADERSPGERWIEVRGPLDLFVLEGWCVGADPQPAECLVRPVNALEAQEDPHGAWRSFANDALARDGGYRRLWEKFEFFVYLAVPDMAAVARWRTEQEQAVPVPKRMKEVELQRFIAHYERLTAWMLETAPDKADLTAVLAADHTVREILSKSGIVP